MGSSFGSVPSVQNPLFAACLELEADISIVFCNISEFEPITFLGICNILVLKLFMSHGILQLGFILPLGLVEDWFI